MGCEVCERLNDNSSLLLETEYWKAFVMREQSNLGRTVVSLKRHCSSLSNLDIEEWKDFYTLIKKVETAIVRAFHPTVFNWGCLMNGAFKEKPYNSHVHWHCRPRYDKDVEFASIVFCDPDFGYHYDFHRDELVSDDVLTKIVEEIKSKIVD